MGDDEKRVDLEQLRRRKLTAAQEQLGDTMWQELCALWERFADEARTLPDNPDGKPLSANALFIVLLSQLIALAQAHQADNDLIIDHLVAYALDECRPKGRLRELLERALSLSLSGDEDALQEAKRGHAHE
jgi:hypothetical protein